jgi:glycerol-3-phosphate dehydrogenase
MEAICAADRMAAPQPIDREAFLRALRGSEPWDAVIVGGGATGLGIAVDAAQRGLRVALIEARDFASGTSSRSTKLIHGGET